MMLRENLMKVDGNHDFYISEYFSTHNIIVTQTVSDTIIIDLMVSPVVARDLECASMPVICLATDVQPKVSSWM